MIKNTKLYSILFDKCPKCCVGDFYKDKNPYNLKTFVDSSNNCPHCGESFEKEVGFYYGAMYVSYGLNVALGVGLFLLTVSVLNFSLIAFLGTYAGLILILFPWIMRKSRLIYINLFVHFDKSKQ